GDHRRPAAAINNPARGDGAKIFSKFDTQGISAFTSEFELLDLGGTPEFTAGGNRDLKNLRVQLGTIQLECRKPQLLFWSDFSATHKAIGRIPIKPEAQPRFDDLFVPEMLCEIEHPGKKACTDFTCGFTDLAIEFNRLFDDQNA